MLRRLTFLLCAATVVHAQTPTPKTWYERGQRYSKLSVQTFEELLKTAPESGYVLALLGEVKTKEKQYTAALYAFHEAARRLPKLRGVHEGAAEVYTETGKPEEARAAHQAETALGKPDCAIEKFYCDYTAERFEAVVNAARLKKTPEALYWLARAYNELATQAFTKLGEFPDSPELHQVKAQILHDNGKFREAAEEWRQILSQSPEDANAAHQLATDLYLSRNFKEALPELEEFLKREPESANLNFFVGDTLLQMEQVEQATPYLEKAVRLDSTLLIARAALGLCYARGGDLRKAIPHLKAALSLDHDGSLHYQLARAYQGTGQPVLAKAMMNRYQELQKASAATGSAQ